MSKPLTVITGASAGIGRAAARAFAGAGHPLLLIARHIEQLDELADGAVDYARVDVADFEALQGAVHAAEVRHGGVGCLINSAGMADARPFEDVEPERYGHEIATNLIGVLNGCKAVLAGMIERKGGTIINVSSISDRKTSPVAIAYTASKYGVRGVSESLREAEAQHGIRVVNVAPGYVRTDIHRGMGITFEEYCQRLGNPDFMSADELAAILLYCYQLPAHLCVRDLVVAPTRSAF